MELYHVALLLPVGLCILLGPAIAIPLVNKGVRSMYP
jgi:hypothetical protein